MNKTILTFVFLTFIFSGIANANEVKCKVYDVICKSKQIVKNTQEYQKQAWSESSVEKGIKKAGEKIKKK